MPAVELLVTPIALLVSLLVWGVFPGLAMRAIVRFYPKGHERRKELLAELYVVDIWKRPYWVASQLELGLVEGLTLRRDKRTDDALAASNLFPAEPSGSRRLGQLVISIPQAKATTARVSALTSLLSSNSGHDAVRLRLIHGSTVRVFEIPYSVRLTPRLQHELTVLFGPNCLK